MPGKKGPGKDPEIRGESDVGLINVPDGGGGTMPDKWTGPALSRITERGSTEGVEMACDGPGKETEGGLCKGSVNAPAIPAVVGSGIGHGKSCLDGLRKIVAQDRNAGPSHRFSGDSDALVPQTIGACFDGSQIDVAKPPESLPLHPKAVENHGPDAISRGGIKSRDTEQTGRNALAAVAGGWE